MRIKTDTLGPTVLRIELLHGLFVVALWLALLPTKFLEPWALAIGALFMGINFGLLGCGVRWVLTPVAGRGRIKLGLSLLVLKLALFLGLLFALLFQVRLDPLSFMLGFTSLLVAIVCERIWATVKGD